MMKARIEIYLQHTVTLTVEVTQTITGETTAEELAQTAVDDIAVNGFSGFGRINDSWLNVYTTVPKHAIQLVVLKETIK